MKRKINELRKYYWYLMTIFLVLVIIGMLNVFSVTFVEDRQSGNMYAHLIRYVVIFGVSLIPAAYVYRRDYHMWRRFAIATTVCATVLLVVVLGMGMVVNGSRRWIMIPGIGMQFQPSELAKLASIFISASLIARDLAKHRAVEFLYSLQDMGMKKGPALPFIPHKAFIGPFIMALLVGAEPDAGTACVIFAIPCALLFLAGAHLGKIKIPFIFFVGAIVAVLVSAPYRMNRIITWWDPWKDAQNLGYQATQGLIAIGTGGVTGQGMGQGLSKFGALPEAHTDFAFAIWAQEWGLYGGIVVLALFFALIYFGAMTAMQCKDRFGTFLALGVTLYLGGQGLINIAMVSNILPVVGVPLPFISYGGTSLFVNVMAAALLLNVCRSNYELAEKEARTKMLSCLPNPKDEETPAVVKN